MTIGTLLVKKILTKACIYFSIITAVYTVLVMITNVDDELVLLDASRIMLFFVGAVLFSIGNMLLKLPSLNSALKVFLHYIIFLFTFYICFLMPMNAETSSTIVGLTLFSILYAIVMAIFLLIRSRYASRNSKQAEYTPKFKK